MGQSVVFAVDVMPEMRERIKEIALHSLDRSIEEAGRVRASDEVAVLVEEFEEPEILLDDFDEPILDEDGRFIEDETRPPIRRARLTVERPVYEGRPAHA